MDLIIYEVNMVKWILLALISLNLSEGEWKKKLGEERYRVMRLKGRERAFVGQYVYTRAPGIYHCAACDSPLFSSEHKYDSGSGWPSFTQPISKEAVYFQEDLRPPLKCYEVLCRSCDCHLGHIFPDGPPPRYKRYTIQSISLILQGE